MYVCIIAILKEREGGGKKERKKERRNDVVASAEIDGQKISKELASYLSTLFDVGGIFGGALAGHISDKTHARLNKITSNLLTLV